MIKRLGTYTLSTTNLESYNLQNLEKSKYKYIRALLFKVTIQGTAGSDIGRSDFLDMLGNVCNLYVGANKIIDNVKPKFFNVVSTIHNYCMTEYTIPKISASGSINNSFVVAVPFENVNAMGKYDLCPRLDTFENVVLQWQRNTTAETGHAISNFQIEVFADIIEREGVYDIPIISFVQRTVTTETSGVYRFSHRVPWAFFIFTRDGFDTSSNRRLWIGDRNILDNLPLIDLSISDLYIPVGSDIADWTYLDKQIIPLVGVTPISLEKPFAWEGESLNYDSFVDGDVPFDIFTLELIQPPTGSGTQEKIGKFIPVKVE